MWRITFTFFCLVLIAAGQDHTHWNDYGGAADSAQYSALKQINRSNVTNLKIAWSYSTGDDNKYSFNPLVVDGIVYVLARNNSIVALDAVSGKPIWVHETGPSKLMTNRGINYWESKDRKDRRLLFAAIIFCRPLMRKQVRRSLRSARMAGLICEKDWGAIRKH